jgi:hypothetical protein
LHPCRLSGPLQFYSDMDVVAHALVSSAAQKSRLRVERPQRDFHVSCFALATQRLGLVEQRHTCACAWRGIADNPLHERRFHRSRSRNIVFWGMLASRVDEAPRHSSRSLINSWFPQHRCIAERHRMIGHPGAAASVYARSGTRCRGAATCPALQPSGMIQGILDKTAVVRDVFMIGANEPSLL